MPEPSGDSLVPGKTITTANGQNAEIARTNMELRGPMRTSLDQVNDNLGGFDPPKAELMDLPKGQAQKPDPTGETKG